MNQWIVVRLHNFYEMNQQIDEKYNIFCEINWWVENNS